MDSEDVLAHANALLALGDWLIPPKGTIVEIRGNRYEIVPPPGSTYMDSFDDTYFRGRPLGADEFGLLWVGRNDYFRIVSLPEGCPPLERWYRLPNE